MLHDIGVITTHRDLTDRVEEIIRKSCRSRFVVAQAVLTHSVSVMKDLVSRGVEVFVTTPGHALFLRENTDLPVVPVPFNAFDVLYTLNHASHYRPESIAMVSYRENHPRIDEIEAVLGYQVEKALFGNNHDETRGIVRRLIAKGIKLVIGGGYISEVARELGIDSMPIRLGDDSIVHALEEATIIADTRNKERREAKRLRAFLDHSFDAIVAVDEKNRINIFNNRAVRLFSIKAEDAIGRRADELLPSSRFEDVLVGCSSIHSDFRRISGVELVGNYTPVLDKADVAGVVATFQMVSAVQRLEENIRKTYFAKDHSARYHFEDIGGGSEAISKTIKAARRYAVTDETILITGESGTGKELFAGSIHNSSNRHCRPFIAINCAAIPASLLESELFGYAPGAFTGGKKGGNPGLFELAHSGTLFLDEIGEMPRPMQSKLLRVLQEREVRRIGSEKSIPVDVRIIAATNRSLEHDVQVHRFRSDLYYRLNVLRIDLPPLRNRLEDIPQIATAFMNRIAPELDEELRRTILTEIRRMPAYHWPGNVRELENHLRRMMVLGNGDSHFIEPLESTAESDPSPAIQRTCMREANLATGSASGKKLSTATRDLEREAIVETYFRLHCNRTAVSKELGIARSTLWRKLKEFGIETSSRLQGTL